jgi:Lamin Tail Domain
MSARIFKASFLTLFLIFPVVSFAQVTITEIFYSPQRSSWIEIHNAGTTSIDLSTYKILDSGASVNGHSISSVSHTPLDPLGYAIIAKDPTAFASQTYPIYKASLAMKVSSDTLLLKDASGKVADKVTFMSSEGGNGDGNSLQRAGNDWEALTPTPGDDASEAISKKIIAIQTKINSMTPAKPIPVTASYTPATSSLIFSSPTSTASYHWWDVVLRFFGLQ